MIKDFNTKDWLKSINALVKVVLISFVITAIALSDSISSSAYFVSSIVSPPSIAETGDWTPPPVPSHVSPADNSFVNTLGLVMDWTDVVDESSNPVTYIYQSAYDPGFTSIAYTSGHLANSQIPAPGTPDNVYYWHVMACDSVGNCSNWSNPWKVTVDNIAPSIPGQIGWTSENPPNGVDYTSGSDFTDYKTCNQYLNYMPVTNLWAPSTDTNSITYEREVYTPIDNRIYSNTTLANNYEHGGGGINGTTYWVRVRAKDQAGNYSSWSDKCSMTYDNIAPVISNVLNLSATPGDPNDALTTITWNTNEDANSTVYYSADSGSTWSSISDSSFVTSHSINITGLTTDVTYSYYVISVDRAGNSATSLTYAFETDGISPSDFVALHDVVLNEFIPDPTGPDNALMPGGEWVELFNKSFTTPYDLTGWSIAAYTNNPSYRLYLTTTNTVSSDPTTSGLTIGPREFFVVYRNGDTNFRLSNTNDRIRLFDNVNPQRIDRYIYDSTQVIENKSIARFPDGSDTWFDPIPTPLNPNILEPVSSSEAKITISDDNKEATITVNNLNLIDKLSYELSYKAYDVDRGIVGNDVDIVGQTDYSKTVDLATCSAGVCTYDENVNTFLLKVILVDDQGNETELEATLD